MDTKKKPDNRFYVYALLDPRKPGKFKYGKYEFNYEPFYIGKGQGWRINFHTADASLNGNRMSNPIKMNKIKKILKIGLNPIKIKIVEFLSNEKAYDLEKVLISKIGRYDLKLGPLTNTTDGGEGAFGSFSPEAKEKIRLAHIGKKRSAEDRKKMSEARMGMKFSAQHKKNLSIARRKRITTLATREKMSKSSKGKINIKKFKVIFPTGEVFITEQGLTKFCEDHGLRASLLHQVINGRRKHHQGWKCERL